MLCLIKKITLNYPKSADTGFFSTGLNNEFETAGVNEPSVFEPMKFYCMYICAPTASTVGPCPFSCKHKLDAHLCPTQLSPKTLLKKWTGKDLWSLNCSEKLAEIPHGKYFSSPEPRAPGELIVVRPSSVNIFKGLL